MGMLLLRQSAKWKFLLSVQFFSLTYYYVFLEGTNKFPKSLTLNSMKGNVWHFTKVNCNSLDKTCIIFFFQLIYVKGHSNNICFTSNSFLT